MVRTRMAYPNTSETVTGSLVFRVSYTGRSFLNEKPRHGAGHSCFVPDVSKVRPAKIPAVYSANCWTFGRSRCRLLLFSLYRCGVQLRSPQIAAAGSDGATKNNVKVAIS